MCDKHAQYDYFTPLNTPNKFANIGVMILLQRIHPEVNENRWYLVAVQPTLFHPCAVVIAWGRRDNDFQQWRVIPVETEEQARDMAERIVARKIRRGYRYYSE